jgi:hypothetical protein
VLSHEAIIDAAWDRSTVPVLRAKFRPSPEALRRARAYAYGGCVIQDIGYYPLSSRRFGDLAHYVRSGDFVVSLIDEARTLDEYAFALGALAHYAADTTGHRVGINPSVPIVYEKYRPKYGTSMTYADNPAAHLRTEFGFDVVQLARGAYPPQAFRDFVGFEVSKPLLERAFLNTYGLPFEDLFGNLDLSIGTFRFAVSSAIPAMTKIAWETKQKEIARLAPGVTRERFVLTWSRAEYERAYGTQYHRPNMLHKTLALLLRVVPRIGPFKVLAFKTPPPAAERLFLESFDQTIASYRAMIAEAGRGRLSLANVNLDTGRRTRPGDYPLADAAYARLMESLARQQFARVNAPLRAHLLAFYADASAPIATKRHHSEWKRVTGAIEALRVRGSNLEGR